MQLMSPKLVPAGGFAQCSGLTPPELPTLAKAVALEVVDLVVVDLVAATKEEKMAIKHQAQQTWR